MVKRLLGLFILTVLLTFPCAQGSAVLGDRLAGHNAEGMPGAVRGDALDQTPLKLAQQQPPYAASLPAEGTGPGQWVEVPGQWVGGTWVPPHRAWAPASSPAAPGGQYGPQPPPEVPPGYGQVGPPPSYMFPAPPQVVPVPGTYVYVVPNIGVDILFYHGYWYRPFGGRWYRALSYNGPWVFFPQVPQALIALPRDYRRLPPGYHPIPHAELQRNWERWEHERH